MPKATGLTQNEPLALNVKLFQQYEENLPGAVVTGLDADLELLPLLE